MRVLGKLAAIIIVMSACFTITSGVIRAEQITVQDKIIITSKVISRAYLIVDKNNQIIEIFCNSNEEPEVVMAMLEYVGGPRVLIDKNIQNQYESLKTYLSFSYGTIYKLGQEEQKVSEASYKSLPEENYVSLLQNIGICII